MGGLPGGRGKRQGIGMNFNQMTMIFANTPEPAFAGSVTRTIHLFASKDRAMGPKENMQFAVAPGTTKAEMLAFLESLQKYVSGWEDDDPAPDSDPSNVVKLRPLG